MQWYPHISQMGPDIKILHRIVSPFKKALFSVIFVLTYISSVNPIKLTVIFGFNDPDDGRRKVEVEDLPNSLFFDNSTNPEFSALGLIKSLSFYIFFFH